MPTSSPTDLVVIILNSTAVQIFWNLPPISEQNGVIIKYNVSVTDVETEEMFFLISFPTDVTFGEMQPYTMYYCSVAAYTLVGSGPFTSPVYIETDEAGYSLVLFYNNYVINIFKLCYYF